MRKPIGVCLCAFGIVWKLYTHTQKHTLERIMWFNVDIYRCAIARAIVGVPLPVLLLYPFLVLCVYIYIYIHYALDKRDSTRNIIQNSNIIHFNIHSVGMVDERESAVAVLYTHGFFPACLPAVSVFAAIWRPMTTTTDNMYYSIGFSGLCCRCCHRRHCHCRARFRSKNITRT